MSSCGVVVRVTRLRLSESELRSLVSQLLTETNEIEIGYDLILEAGRRMTFLGAGELKQSKQAKWPGEGEQKLSLSSGRAF